MLAIFTYNFPEAAENFEKAGVELSALSNYQILIDLALKNGTIHQEELESLNEWRINPSQWGR
jgi:orotate phosphoribosyltransferase